MQIKMGSWLGSTRLIQKPEKIFVVHGEDAVCDEFAQCLNTEYGQDAEAPFSGAEFDLAANCWVKAGIKVRLAEIKPAAKRANQVFARLLEAGKTAAQGH